MITTASSEFNHVSVRFNRAFASLIACGECYCVGEFNRAFVSLITYGEFNHVSGERNHGVA
jgi:hypothetical protein